MFLINQSSFIIYLHSYLFINIYYAQTSHDIYHCTENEFKSVGPAWATSQ